eukprot:tig00001214_g7549.t1
MASTSLLSMRTRALQPSTRLAAARRVASSSAPLAATAPVATVALAPYAYDAKALARSVPIIGQRGFATAAKKSPAAELRALFSKDGCVTIPCAYDALSAKLVQRAGFPATFMSGFCTAGARLAFPDTQLISFGEMLDQGRNICGAVSIPVIGDGDTGYGNALNVKRTVREYARAGFACIMIEDQLQPKRCGHTKGKAVVGREEALARVRAAVDATREGADIMILARTDARQTLGFEEALWRCNEFRKLGAEITFMEAPESEAEMAEYCRRVDGWKMANMLEFGKTPILPNEALGRMGFKLAIYPLTLMSASVKAMQETLAALKKGDTPLDKLLPFSELRDVVGFPEYYAEEEKYATAADRAVARAAPPKD